MTHKIGQTALPALPIWQVTAERGTPEHDYLMMHIDGIHGMRQMVHDGRRCMVVKAEQQPYPAWDVTVFTLQVMERVA